MRPTWDCQTNQPIDDGVVLNDSGFNYAKRASLIYLTVAALKTAEEYCYRLHDEGTLSRRAPWFYSAVERLGGQDKLWGR